MAQALASIMSESGRLGNRPAHGDGSWIVRPRIGARSGAGPIGETVASGSGSTNRDNRSIISPPTSRTHRATGPLGHCEIVLCRECRCEGLVGDRSNGVRDCSATAPACPYVPNACATALRRSCSNGVTRTRLPGKRLRRSVRSTINRE